MLAVEVTVLVDRFRLDPDAEFHADIVNALDELAKSSAELLLVRRPIAETLSVIFA